MVALEEPSGVKAKEFMTKCLGHAVPSSKQWASATEHHSAAHMPRDWQGITVQTVLQHHICWGRNLHQTLKNIKVYRMWWWNFPQQKLWMWVQIVTLKAKSHRLTAFVFIPLNTDSRCPAINTSVVIKEDDYVGLDLLVHCCLLAWQPYWFWLAIFVCVCVC